MSPRWPSAQDLPGAVELAAQSLVDADGWPWLLERVEAQITSESEYLVSGNGAKDWDDYQYRIGVVAGLRKLIDIVDEYVDTSTGERHDGER